MISKVINEKRSFVYTTSSIIELAVNYSPQNKKEQGIYGYATDETHFQFFYTIKKLRPLFCLYV